MTRITDKISQKNLIITFSASLCGGFLNGFLGAAGGIVLGLVMTKILSDNGGTCDRRDIYANVQIAMICVSLVSFTIYSSRGDTGLIENTWIILPAIAGGVAGSMILRKISSKTVGKVFALLTIYSGIRMITG